MPKREEKSSFEKEIKSLGIWLIVFGVIHIIASGFLSFFWGFVLIGFGIFSITSKKPIVLLIFGVLILVAGLSNLSSILYIGEEGISSLWFIFGGFQIYWGIKEIIRYNKIVKSHLKKGQKVLMVFGIISLVIIIYLGLSFLEGFFYGLTSGVKPTTLTPLVQNINESLTCDEGYVLGWDSYCYPACGGSTHYCSDENSYCYNNQCILCPEGYSLATDELCYPD